MKALIILGCEGHYQFGFRFCNGAENVILDLEKIERDDSYFDVVQYFDSVVKIFEKVCIKPHVISNAIYKLYELGHINDELYKHINHFYDMHRRCGLILKAQPKATNS